MNESESCPICIKYFFIRIVIFSDGIQRDKKKKGL